MDSRTTGYNLFCKELSSEEGVNQLATPQRFTVCATRWATLTPESRNVYKRRAAQKNTLSTRQKQQRWNKCVKKMLQVMDEMQSLQPTSGYFVLVPTGGTPRYGDTPEGNSFVTDEYETVVSGFCKGLDKQTTSRQVITVHDIRQLFNRKCAEAVGQPGKKMT